MSWLDGIKCGLIHVWLDGMKGGLIHVWLDGMKGSLIHVWLDGMKGSLILALVSLRLVLHTVFRNPDRCPQKSRRVFWG